MIDPRLESQASRYALGILPPTEARAFEAILRHNPQLQQLVRELRGSAQGRDAPAAADPGQDNHANRRATGHVPEAAPVPLPDPARVPPWMAWMPWAMAACFAILCMALISVGHKLRRQAIALHEQVAHQAATTSEWQQQMAQAQLLADSRTSNYEHRLVQTEQRATQRIHDLQRQTGLLTNQLVREQTALRAELQVVRDRGEQLAREKKVLEEALGGSALLDNQRLTSARVAILRPTADGSPRALGAIVWLATDRRGLLVLENMPPPHVSQDYQLWLLDPNSPGPVSGGVFRPDTSGVVRLEYQANLPAVERFAVTLESKGGAARPTGKTVLTSP